jgi:hypothetical protein
MDEKTRAEVERAYAQFKGAEKWANEAQKELFTLLQKVLREGEPGDQAELVRLTGYHRERLRQIKNGKWYRTPPLT